MPTRNIEALDDALIADGSADFSGGMVSAYKPHIIGGSAFSNGLNLVVDTAGAVSSRRGSAALGSPGSGSVTGLLFYKWDNSYLLRTGNSLLKAWDGSSWTTITGWTPSSSASASMCQLVGNVYGTDGGAIYKWDGDISHAAAALGGTSPSASSRLCVHDGRIMACGLGGSIRDNVYYSGILNDSTWASVTVGGGYGDGIKAIHSWQRFYLVAFRSSSIHLLNTQGVTPATDWSTEVVSTTVGCIAPDTVAQVGNDVFFLSRDGVRTLAQADNEQKIGVGLPISEPVNDIINRINWAFVGSASAVFHNNLYILSLPLDSSTTPNYCLVYSTLTKSWFGLWSGWEATRFVRTDFSGTPKLNFGRTDGGVWQFYDWKAASSVNDTDYTDNGTAYTTSLTTRGFAFGDVSSPKTGYNYELEFFGSNADVSVRVNLDQSSDQLNTTTPTANDSLLIPFLLPALLPANGTYRVARDLAQYGCFRSVQFVITSTSARLALRSVVASGFWDSVQDELN